MISSLTETVSPWSTDPRLCSEDCLRRQESQGLRRQESQGVQWGQFESAICLIFPISLAKECPSFLLPCLIMKLRINYKKKSPKNHTNMKAK